MVEKHLKVIQGQPRGDTDSIPDGLGPNGKALWRQVQREYEISDVGGKEMLS